MYEDKVPEKALSLPAVKGYKVLIAMPQMKNKDGSIILPDQHLEREALASIVGNVISLGSDAYKDTGKFPTGPWCAEGDWVLFRSYAGTRFKSRGQEFRLINDDSIEAVVADPREIERA